MSRSTAWSEDGAVKNVLRKFAQTSSVHGVWYLGSREESVKLRAFWAIAVVLALCGLLATVFGQLGDMFSYSTLINQEVKIKDKLPFPAVTICNMNFFRRSAVEEHPILLAVLSENFNITYLNDEHFVQHNETLSPQHVDEADAEVIRNTSHTLDGTFLKCVWMGIVRNCGDLFKSRQTDSGMCFTFNARVNGLGESMSQTRAGSEDGLVLTLNVIQSEYLVSDHTVSAGFHVILHEFTETPFEHSGFTVGPGFSNNVQLKMRQVTYLSSPYIAYGGKSCVSTNGVKLKYFPDYDSGACLWECKIDYIKTNCGCKGIFDPATVAVPYCNASQALCYTEHEDLFWTDDSIRKECPCFPLCQQYIFDTSLSMSYFPSDAFATEYQYFDTVEEYRKNILQMKLFYADFFFEKMTQVPEHTFNSICANLGGQMGLYLGISILSVVELIHTLVQCLWLSITRRLYNRELSSKTPVKPLPLETTS